MKIRAHGVVFRSILTLTLFLSSPAWSQDLQQELQNTGSPAASPITQPASPQPFSLWSWGDFSPVFAPSEPKTSKAYIRIPLSDLNLFKRQFGQSERKDEREKSGNPISSNSDDQNQTASNSTSDQTPASNQEPAPDQKIDSVALVEKNEQILQQALDHPERLNDIAQTVFGVMSNPDVAYVDYPIDEAATKEIALSFLKNLDGYRLFFTDRDVKKLTSSRQIPRIQAALTGKDLVWVFEVFDLYLARQKERFGDVKNFLSLPNGETSFTLPEKWMSKKEQSRVWRASVEDDLVGLMINDKVDRATAIATLLEKYREQTEQTQKMSQLEILEIFLQAYTKHVDPHSIYLAPRSKNNFQARLNRTIDGVGVVWSMNKETGDVLVHEVSKSGPAARLDLLKKNDKLLSVQRQNEWIDVKNLSMSSLTDLMSGSPGSTLTVKIERKNDQDKIEEVIVSIPRERIRVDGPGILARRIEIAADGSSDDSFVALSVNLPVFYSGDNVSSAADFRSVLADGLVQNPDVDAVILDLRGNGGGVLTEALQIVGTFLDKGSVVQIKNASDQEQILQIDQGSVLWGGPLLVLIDRNSASASEITAGALQDHGRAVIVGERSFGKGSAQTLFDIDAYAKMPSSVYGQINVTTMLFFRPSGQSTQFVGVTPDVSIGPGEDEKYGERAYPRAIASETLSAHGFSGLSLSSKFNFKSAQDLANQRWNSRFWSSQLNRLIDLSKPTTSRTLIFDERQNQLNEQEMLKKSLDAAWKAEGQTVNDGADDDVILREAAHVARDLFEIK